MLDKIKKKNDDYYFLNTIIEKFKAADSPTLKDYWWERIVESLVHHIRSLMNIMTGTNYKVSPAVHRIMLSNFQSASSIKNTSELVYTAQEIIRHAGLTKEDVRQQIMLEILEIIRIYEDRGMSFLQVLSWLLPRRMANWLWKIAKDASAQFHTKPEFDDPTSRDPDEKEDKTADQFTMYTHPTLDSGLPKLQGLSEIEVLKLTLDPPPEYVELKKAIWLACEQQISNYRRTKRKNLQIIGIW